MTHRPNVITHTREYTVLPGVVWHTFIIFGLYEAKPVPPGTKSWRCHWQFRPASFQLRLRVTTL